jgi:hypothetical protein
MTDREIMQQALDALKIAEVDGNCYYEATELLRNRLAHCDRCGKRLGGEGDIHTCTPLEQKSFEQWWDAGDDIPNDAPYTPDTPIQFAWAGWQAALAQPKQEGDIHTCRPDPIGDAQDKLIAEMAAQPEQEQDSTCNKTLRAEGKGYPRTCMKCGKGPCIADLVIQAAREALREPTVHFKCTVIDDQHPNGVPLEQWNATPPAAQRTWVERNKLAAWMMAQGYATGHGDTTEDLLEELRWQVKESEREACAKVCDHMAARCNDIRAAALESAAENIRARGNT